MPSAPICTKIAPKNGVEHGDNHKAGRPLALAKMLDHADLSMLLSVYYKQDAQADADLLG